MPTPLSVLLVEDTELDGELILRSLRKAGLEVDMLRVETEAAMQAALAAREWDVVLSDHNLPAFSADAALRTMHAAGLDLPFIIVSGNIGEEMAVALMKAGAHDYVMKGNLARLAPAVTRELAEARHRADHAQAERALREAEERWNFALEGAGYGVWDWDLAQDRMLYSACWLQMHGYGAGEVAATGAGCAALIHPDDAPAQGARLAAYLDDRLPRYTSEHRELCKDGRWIWVLDHGMVVRRGPDGAPRRMICTQADITERKQAEQALKELNEHLESRVEARTAQLRQAMQQVTESEKLASLGGLVAGVAHELNTPIGNMLLAASSLEEKLASVARAIEQGSMTRTAMLATVVESLEASRLIVRNGARSSELIASFKRVAVDQTSQRRRRFDLRGTVHDIVCALGTATRHAQVAVEVEIPDGIEMDSYPGHLEQIMTNLVMNSLVHGCDGMANAEIVVGARTDGASVTLTYRDNGKGIAPEVLHRVFEPFYTTRLGQGGSGLGLTIVHNLVHGVLKGQIRLVSTAGSGVQVEICLPRCTPD